MIKKKFHSAAFTLIELLVVITIIGILAGIALPVFNTVQVKGSQTKSLAQAKQVGLALKLFASDNDGSYPKTGVPDGMSVTANDSNSCFAALFPTYVQSEQIFGNKLSAFQTKTPDNALDPSPQPFPSSKTLATGENVYAYVAGLNDAGNPSSPLVADGFASSASGKYAKTGKGGVWSGQKAVVIRLDNSGSLENVDQNTLTVLGYIDDTGSKKNIFLPVNGQWLDSCTVCNPR